MDTNEVLTRGVNQVLPTKEGLESLMLKRKIKLYQGFDPSAPSLHLGNFVGLMKLRQFQKLGHEIIFLVGDFTGMIGDPTDKLSVRKKLTREQVLENAKAWREQAGRVIDFQGDNPAKIIFNSEWSDKITFKDLIEITSNMTVQQLIERDMFQERIKNKEPIYLHEFLYPIAQGYDSVVMDVDLEIGGNDQLFNMMAGRTLMKAINNKDKYVLTTKLLVDKDGKKVGKTTGNALFLDSEPEKFFEGIMSFPNEVIPLAYELLTELSLDGIEERCKKDPYNETMNLAYEIVSMLWGEGEAKVANKVYFDRRTGPSEEYAEHFASIPSFQSLSTISNAMSSVTGRSNTEVKNLISQGAVTFYPKNGDPIKINREQNQDISLISQPGTVSMGSVDIRIDEK